MSVFLHNIVFACQFAGKPYEVGMVTLGCISVQIGALWEENVILALAFFL